MTKQSLLVVITIIQTLVVFALGIVGNKIAELVQIKPIVLVAATCVLLASSIILNLLRTRAAPSTPIETRKRGISRRFIPRTMISIFPFGMLVGLLAGSLLSLLCDFSLQEGSLLPPVVVFSAFGSLIIGTLLALFVDGNLAGALTFGYGLGSGMAILVIMTHPDVEKGAVCCGTILIWLFGVVFIGNASQLREIGEALTKERF